MNQAHNNTPVALITGANKGIGQEAARQLAQRGFKVIVAARKADAGQKAAQEIQDSGGDAQSVVLDVTRDKSVQAAAKEVAKITPRLDVLVNNAGILIDLETPPRETEISKLQQRSIPMLSAWSVSPRRSCLPSNKATTGASSTSPPPGARFPRWPSHPRPRLLTTSPRPR